MESFVQAFLDGISHIFCLDALDHIIYLLVLTACYDYSKLKRIFWLVTAFTIGHAITFILSALGMTPGVRSFAEIAIPITIALTAIMNWLKRDKKGRQHKEGILVYLVAIFFGSLHGLAIGSMIQMKLIGGESFLAQLAGFNLGVEMAQIVVVIGIVFVQMLLMGIFRIKLSDWRIGSSGVGFGAALMILMKNL